MSTAELSHTLQDFAHDLTSGEKNVGDTERILSLVGGGLALMHGLTHPRASSLFWLAIGAGLLLRGSTGHCSVYQALGQNTTEGCRSCS